jgi:hypothetical protein
LYGPDPPDKLKHSADARRWFDQAVARMTELDAAGKLTWEQRLELESLRKEAEQP